MALVLPNCSYFNVLPAFPHPSPFKNDELVQENRRAREASQAPELEIWEEEEEEETPRRLPDPLTSMADNGCTCTCHQYHSPTQLDVGSASASLLTQSPSPSATDGNSNGRDNLNGKV